MEVFEHGHVHQEGPDQEHHEKKSVMKKVKEKAKKIKDTITKKYEHGEEHHDSGEEEQRYSEEEDKEEDAEIHGGPMYEREAARGFVESHEKAPLQEGVKLGGAAVNLEKDPRAPPPAADAPPVPGSYQPGLSSAGTENPKSEPEPGLIRSFESMSTEEKTSPSEAQTAPKGESEQHQPGLSSAGEPEPGLVRSFEPMSTEEKTSPPETQTAPKGESEQHQPGLSSAGEPETELIRSFESMSTEEKTSPSEAQTAPRGESEEHQPQSELACKEKTTSTLVDKAVDAKEAIVMAAAGTAEYGKKIAETVYEKIAPQKKEEEAKMEEEEKGELGAEAIQGSKPPDKWETMKEYLAEKLSPGEEDRALCEVISESIQTRKEEEGDIREETEEKHPAVEPSGEKKSQKGVVGKIKGAVVSAFGGQHSSPAKAGEEGVPSSPDEQERAPRLQESTN